MPTTKTERKKTNARSGRFIQKIGSTVYEVRVRFDTAKTESLEDKILRLIKRDLDSGQIREITRNDLKIPGESVIIDLPQADRLPERGSV